ncbi:MAG: hypothetical protein LBJ12_08530 [Oscillospiraceae bacterium]|jgi:multimeric flavodoxin WrbA|nr:hypothetical protein [Oscillospiraceae bacterium]
MKTLVLYYSYTGHAKELAEALAAQEAADIMEISDWHRPGKLIAYIKGCPAAAKGRSWAIAPIFPDWSAYERVVLFSPVWAGGAPPAVNAMLEQLPGGKSVEVHMVSASGKSKCRSRIESAIKMKGSRPASFEDIRA